MMQLFRDLFANEALRPGEQILVGTLAILFTDLRGFTSIAETMTPAELMDLLAASERVRETMTWKLTQFSLGRPMEEGSLLDEIQ